MGYDPYINFGNNLYEKEEYVSIHKKQNEK